MTRGTRQPEQRAIVQGLSGPDGEMLSVWHAASLPIDPCRVVPCFHLGGESAHPVWLWLPSASAFEH